LSKIGKEKRKSGLFRLCRSQATFPPAENAISAGFLELAANAASDRGVMRRAAVHSLRYGREGSASRQRAKKAIKKLPQVGQEPVEAVESRPISPDGLYITRNRKERKDISEKAAIISPE
jgi:hypothetical protein